ncbi:MAG: lytic transglycosylase domain-containing protein [Candidatus Aminicenantaceae bacterium]
MIRLDTTKTSINLTVGVFGVLFIIFFSTFRSLYGCNDAPESNTKKITLQNIQSKIPSTDRNKYNHIISTFANKHNVPQMLIRSIISVESDYNPHAVSSKGAVGLMQLMPDTAKKYGVKNLYDPWENIGGGVKYLKDLIEIYNGKTDLVLGAYNAGQEAIKKHKGIPPYPETLNYIRKVKRKYQKTTIRASTKVYKFYDSSGRLVLTNNPRLIAIHGN